MGPKLDFLLAMMKYEVTFADYDKYAAATGKDKPEDQSWGRGKRPVIKVSWNDAKAYAKWLSGQTGKRYHLPSESEWEYAARAGSSTNTVGAIVLAVVRHVMVIILANVASKNLQSQLAVFKPMHLGFMTCTATYGNGLRIVTTRRVMAGSLLMARHVDLAIRSIACCAAWAGPVVQ